MNVGIITFHRAVNYGAVFQTYALKQALEAMGATAYVIDHRCNAIEQPYLPKIRRNSFKNTIMDIVMYGNRKKKKDNFDIFLQKYILPANYDTNSTFENLDAIITGSDQVWNSTMTGHDMTFFLDIDNLNVKRISYAACTGKVNYSETEKNAISKALNKFSAISVRDGESLKKISELTDLPIIKTVDPTMLIPMHKWKKVMTSVKYDNYILVFAVGFSEQLSDFAHDLAKKMHKKVIFLNSNFRKKGKGIYLDTVGPDVALGLIYNADYIVTNSFHGTVMSLVMKKEVFVELEHDKKGRNLRVESLLTSLEIQGREITSSKYQEDMFAPINWSHVEDRIMKEREYSLEYLSNSLR